MTTIFTVNGFRGDLWLGPQADVGRYLSNQNLNIAYWQPIGYDNGQFPLGGGARSGLDELHHQLEEHPGPFLTSAWSLGAIVTVELLREMRGGGRNAHRLPDWKCATTFGNPYRQADHWSPQSGIGAVPNPGGAGIGGPRYNLTDSPEWWLDYAHTGDMYTCCDTGPRGDDQRIIFDIVLEKWSGFTLDLWEECMEVVSKPLQAAPSILWAIIEAIIFYGGGTKQHVNYDATALGALNYSSAVARRWQ